MESDEFDAGILAAAGMQRLGLDEHIAQVIPTDVMIPAVGQGAMAIEIRKNDRVVGPLCDAITDPETWRAVTAERHVLCALEGGCQVPMGAYAHRTESGNFALDAFVASLDGERFLRTHVEGEAEQSQALAQQVVDELLAQGAQAIIEELR
jgi:hydroxymethylbilane synthase